MNIRRVQQVARDQAHIIAVLVMVLVPFALPKRPPAGIVALGVQSGCVIALQAIGLVLVYNANRIINFAQVAMGSLAGTLFQQLVFRNQFLRWFRIVCPPCVNRFSPGLRALNWYLALGT